MLSLVAQLEVLFLHEMYCTRQSFLKPEYNFKWFGRNEILALERRQEKEKTIFLEKIMQSNHESNFFTNYSENFRKAMCHPIEKIRSILIISTSEAEKKEFEDLLEFRSAFEIFNSEYDNYSLKDIKSEIWNLQIFIHGTQTKVERQNIQDCSICLDATSDCITSCSHQFHKTCLMEWFKNYFNCPLCRSENIFSNDIVPIGPNISSV
jgi:hypothetical protein